MQIPKSKLPVRDNNALNVVIHSAITTKETLSLGPGASQRATDVGANTVLRLHPASAPPAAAKAHFAATLNDGSAIIDLLTLTNDNGRTIAAAGLRVQALKVQNPNPDPLLIGPAGPAGYPLVHQVPPQGECLVTCNDLLPEIEGNCHLLALSGTGSETSNWLIILG
jgi:hypothetical protein